MSDHDRAEDAPLHVLHDSVTLSGTSRMWRAAVSAAEAKVIALRGAAITLTDAADAFLVTHRAYASTIDRTIGVVSGRERLLADINRPPSPASPCCRGNARVLTSVVPYTGETFKSTDRPGPGTVIRWNRWED